MTRTCLITGATGALGPVVVREFVERGYAVRGFARNAPPAGTFDRRVEFVRGDVTDEANVRQAMPGVQVVVHLAALLHILNPRPSMEKEYERINVRGTETLVRCAMQAGVERIVYISSIAVYGRAGGTRFSESSKAAPDTWYARSKLGGERVVLSAHDSAGGPIGTVLRLAAVYGSRVKGNYRRLIRGLRRGYFVPVGQGSNHRALIYDKDVARAVVIAAEHPNAAGEIFNVSDAESPTVTQIIETICEALGRKRPRLTVPLAPVRWGVKTADFIASRIGIRLPVSPATIEKYVEDVMVDSSRIRDRLGFVAHWNQANGWRDAIEELERSGR